jgi:hypothetical protein
LTLGTTVSDVAVAVEAKYDSTKAYEASMKLSTEAFGGTVCAKAGYKSTKDASVKVGYSTTVSGVDVAASYTFGYNTGTKTASHKVGASAVYKF